MSSYQPILPLSAPALIDTPIRCESSPFTQAPALSFLKESFRSMTASSLYYDPLTPFGAIQAPVTYNESETLTTLSGNPLKLRHNGTTADMEIYVDTYTLVRKEKTIAPFNLSQPFTPMQPGDRYERYTSGYVFAQVPVPRASDRVWDGRFATCVDNSGNFIDASSRLPRIRSECRQALEQASLVPYTVFGLGGLGHTRNRPPNNIYKPEYERMMTDFLGRHYTSNGIDGITRGTATLTRNDSVGSGNVIASSTSSTRTAAVLDGNYFVRWVRLTIVTTTYTSSSSN